MTTLVPRVRIVTVTPKMAEKWLDANTRNRSVRQHRVVMYAAIIRKNEWELTGDAIVIDEDGALLNGQHRLAAIVLADKAAQLLVLEGLPSKAQDVMDRGLARSMADALKLRGETDVNNLAAALRWLHRIDYSERTGHANYRHAELAPTVPVMLRILDDHPDVRESIKIVRSGLLNNRIMRPGHTTALHYRARMIDHDEADAFFEQVFTGAKLEATSPIFALRRAVIGDKQRHTSKMPDFREAALIIKAWNFWRDGREIQALTWHGGGTKSEAFPIMH